MIYVDIKVCNEYKLLFIYKNFEHMTYDLLHAYCDDVYVGDYVINPKLFTC
jgi:hypothetical protein